MFAVRMHKVAVLLSAALSAVLVAACSESSTNPDPPGTTDNASGQVSSNQSGTITTPAGAKITVPMYAVPLATTQANGTMTFSIERQTTNTLLPPSGESVVSDLYRFGPDGFTFAAPVKITIPVPNATSSDKVNLYRIDPTTGAAMRYPSEYDPATRTVSALTSGLSLWGATSSPATNTADGAVRLINTSSNMWLSSCVDTYSLAFPFANPRFGEASAAPAGTIGWNSTIIWGLPQGTYRLCCQMATAGTLSSPPGSPSFWYVDAVSVNKASIYPSYETSRDLSYGAPPSGATAGRCPCTPVPTPSVGTGQVQVTLTWHSTAAVDLDLYVTDPAGNTVSYQSPTVASGGTLDRDNKCGNYENGRPENVFWSTAATGEYVVVVKWFSNCSSGLTSMPFELRVVNKTATNTFAGTLTASQQSVEITRFTVR